MKMNRRQLLATSAGAALVTPAAAEAAPKAPFKGSWESLAENYQTPEWLRDAKLGIWAHWGPQCVPEWGDW